MTAPLNIAGLRPDTARRTGLVVFLKALRVDAEIGLYAHEKGRVQPLIVDVEVELGEQRVGGIDDTVDYETLAMRARNAAAAGHHDLVEEYAERLARSCLEDSRVRRVRVRIEKPGCVPGAEAAGCEVGFTRE